MYGLIDKSNTRRFVRRGEDPPVVYAIVYTCKAYTTYSQVGVWEDGQRPAFVSTPRTFWPDEVEEIR